MLLPYRTGFGYDVHAFAPERKLILGGIEIPHEKGLLGHSDADVLLHAISDALLGALALGDIGKHFPDTDEKYKNADSGRLLSSVYELIKKKGYRLGNLDAVIVMQRPKVARFIDPMREKTAQILESDPEQVSIKATTTEHLGFTGREEGVAAYATVLLVKTEEA
ncbi:MAG: 2-C-methyl-D-erythritol 2,4-cyclodiphosphate synthase [Ignavibacteria bacterium]|jgi:2-C-methyl-D-erythritol 2,4-cyclodiphosphate synthase|nr:2-C-methyl-D-erythritol 2,4-cyclodiphosphate synthase [Ignavibacteria bacterium]MCU7504813.1 2-C-methyl-D-erythritol 2,4-cyclodiphosphate synthase [Ignavibacteria bacterium]MCU7517699.1 2-C-methyl-D-erythritol 2,4-cyclodiphosphate synthase [Ignavibacteria bacterium]